MRKHLLAHLMIIEAYNQDYSKANATVARRRKAWINQGQKYADVICKSCQYCRLRRGPWYNRWGACQWRELLSRWESWRIRVLRWEPGFWSFVACQPELCTLSSFITIGLMPSFSSRRVLLLSEVTAGRHGMTAEHKYLAWDRRRILLSGNVVAELLLTRAWYVYWTVRSDTCLSFTY